MGTNNSRTRPEETEEEEVIFRKWTTGRNGKRVYPKNGGVIKIVMRAKSKK